MSLSTSCHVRAYCLSRHCARGYLRLLLLPCRQAVEHGPRHLRLSHWTESILARGLCLLGSRVWAAFSGEKVSYSGMAKGSDASGRKMNFHYLLKCQNGNDSYSDKYFRYGVAQPSRFLGSNAA